jgi:very-short-patch-repair endonuclease
MAIPSNILKNARAMRARMTNAEQFLWQILRNRRFCGVKFRRQHPYDRFVLDFYCHDAKLAIELDGGGHNDEAQKVYDEERTRILEEAGIIVLRFWNHDVLNNFESVLERLYAVLCAPSPGAPRHPLPEGEGNFEKPVRQPCEIEEIQQ